MRQFQRVGNVALIGVCVGVAIAGCGGRQATPQELQQARYCQKYLERCGDPMSTTCPDDPVADKYRCGE
jgi:hypothetical protein